MGTGVFDTSLVLRPPFLFVENFSRKKILKKKTKYVINKYSSKKEELNMSKKQRDAGKIFVRIMAGILAGLMILGVAGTLIYYITL